MCEQMANQLRLPLVRMVEGSGGGGSVKTIETEGRSNVPGVKGWEWVVENMGTVPRVALGLGSVAGPRRGASGGGAFLRAGQGAGGAVRRRPARGRAARREARQAGARRLEDPCPQRRHRLCGRQRGARLRPRAPLPLLPALLHRQPCGAGAADRRPRAARGMADGGRAARPAQGLSRAAHRRGGGGPGQLLRIRAGMGPVGRHGVRAARRLARGGDGVGPLFLRRRLDGGRLPQGAPLRRSRPRPSICRWSIWSIAPAS